MIPTLLLVTIIVFLLIRLVPGDVVDLMLAEQEWNATAEDRAELEAKLGLDKPIHIQYGIWISDVARGNFGTSLWSSRPVVDEIRSRLPVSFELGILAILTGLIIAIPLGIYSAIRQDTSGDYVGRSVAILFMCVPIFWAGTLIMVFPSIWWHWSPSMEYIPIAKDPLGNLGMFIVPALIVGLGTSGATMRMMRTMMLEVLRSDYIRTAWSKGLSERAVVFGHALKNALIPIVTIVGFMLPTLVGGQVIVEQIFCLPGMGTLLVDSLNNRDYPMLSGVNLLIATTVAVMNLLVDLSYAYLDPRVRYG
jgi:peptide/nickel transport system permease protein